MAKTNRNSEIFSRPPVKNGGVTTYTPQRIERVIRLCERQFGDSESKVASRLGVNRSTLNRLRRGLTELSPRTTHALDRLENDLVFYIKDETDVRKRTVGYLIQAVRKHLEDFSPTQRRRLKRML